MTVHEESNAYLTEQILTYIGNKRKLLSFIGQALVPVKRRLGKEKLDLLDGFSGSGIVARFFKQHASTLWVNDLELYARTLGECYLSNRSSVDWNALVEANQFLNEHKLALYEDTGLIGRCYAPRDDENIQDGERVFYTTRNARILDNLRRGLDEHFPTLRPHLLAPLLVKASIHANTSGVFKGFYKNSTTKRGQFGGNGRNALGRILREIELPLPVLSRFECDVHIHREDTNELVKSLPELDVAYFDPPYNQHPYGSNYFMLNLLCTYEEPEEVSLVSGIPKGWNKSKYNQKRHALDSLNALIHSTPAKFIVISYNNEGFVSQNEMVEMLKTHGKVEVLVQDYATFRGSRNLRNRSLKVKEILFVLEKN